MSVAGKTIAWLKALVSSGGDPTPAQLAAARRVMRVGGIDGATIRTLLDTHAYVEDGLCSGTPKQHVRYGEAKPVAFWSEREIAAWQADYPAYRWDVWCVVCGVH